MVSHGFPHRRPGPAARRGLLRRGAPSPEDTRVAELRAEAAEARERVGRMRAIEQKGDSPPMTSKEAESAAVLAENAVLDAEAAADSGGDSVRPKEGGVASRRRGPSGGARASGAAVSGEGGL